MKRILMALGVLCLALGLNASAQGRRAGGPHAWGDRNGDGKCDITGQAVGQGRGRGVQAARQGGRGAGCGRQCDCGRMGRCARIQAAPAPEAKK